MAQADEPANRGFTLWSPFAESTSDFEPSAKDFMINYRVENLSALVEELKKEGVTITDEIESFEYGKFIHILDIEGNKIELWEATDIEYDIDNRQNKIIKQGLSHALSVTVHFAARERYKDLK